MAMLSTLLNVSKTFGNYGSLRRFQLKQQLFFGIFKRTSGLNAKNTCYFYTSMIVVCILACIGQLLNVSHPGVVLRTTRRSPHLLVGHNMYRLKFDLLNVSV